ncbi:MAG: type I methionyl aminopeptidase [Chloroflexota bacterium]
MSIGSEKDMIGLQRAGRLVVQAINAMKAAMAEGVTTQELDDIGRKIIEEAGARPAPEYFYDYPAATCISINEEVAHGIPGKRRIRSGDLVNIDVSVEFNGYVADTGASIPFGKVPPIVPKLCKATQEALQEAMNAAKAGKRMVDVQKVIDKVAQKRGFTVIRNLSGHGIGRKLHEAPGHVPDYSRKKDRRRFTKGMVLTLEPFLSTGPQHATETSDGWTLVTESGNYTAQYEHTIVVTDSKPIILTEGLPLT